MDDGDTRLMTTGDLANETGLSLRSIRWYDQVGLVPPAARSSSGHRLYDAAALERLLLIMQMKPLDFSLEEMGAVLDALDTSRDAGADDAARSAAREKLAMFADLVDQRWEWLQERVTIADRFRRRLRQEVRDAQRAPTRRGARRSP